MRFAIAALLVMASAPAYADGAFFEGDVGLMTPIGDDEYETNIDEGLKLGLRLGTRTGPRALDVSFDFTPINDDLFGNVDVQRFRFMVGGRYEYPLSAKAHLFVRGAAGIDLVHVSASGQILGVEFDFSQTDVGLGLEVSGGVMFDVGKAQVGAKLGFPFAFHFDDDDPDDPDDTDLDYTGVDLDVAFVLGVRF